jgi:hypothetical protein
MYGDAKNSGAPTGNRNGRYRTGQYTQEMVELRRMVMRLLRAAAEVVEKS